MRKSYRSPLTAMLREADAALAQARATGAPLEEVTAMRAERPARRRVLAGGAATLAASALLPRASRAGAPPRVAIIGAGIAGLACALELQERHGIQATIYEWNVRLGGRIQTLRNYFANGQTTEQHAEFVSSEHAATLALAKRFGLALENTYADPKGSRDTYWFGARYSQEELNQDWQAFGWNLFCDAVHQAPRATYLHHTPVARQWDRMSVPEWIERYVPGGTGGRFGKLCMADVISEYGGPPENQSALNLIYILGYNDSNPDSRQSPLRPMLAGSDEHWHIEGGNDQLISGLAALLPEGTIALGRQLTAVAENSDGSFTCTFATGPEVVTDHVVLAIPFMTLRNVDLSGVSLTARKRKAIATLMLGNNAKIQIQVAGRPWTKDGYSGDVLCDAPLDGTWDGTTYQAHGSGRAPTEILIAVPGGADGQALASKYDLAFGTEQGPAPDAMVADVLAQLEPILPGTTAAWNAGPKRAWYNDGNIDQHLLGAWSQYNVGQYTGFAGIEGAREGNLHFAGEHTSIVFQGFIEGGLRSGYRAAHEIAS
jgi:monoamine oxidase